MPAHLFANLVELLHGHRSRRGLARTASLLRANAALADVAVLHQGAGETRQLVAYLVPAAGAALAPGALHRALAPLLPGRLLPDAYVVLDGLARHPDGTIDRARMPVPDAGVLGLRLYQPPRGPLEQAIAARWERLLGLPEVGRSGHFFELGGHSALAVQLIYDLRRELGVDATMRDLRLEPRVQGLAALLRTRPALRAGAPAAASNSPAPSVLSPA